MLKAPRNAQHRNGEAGEEAMQKRDERKVSQRASDDGDEVEKGWRIERKKERK
ncbi:hypothetical protein Scep_024904 [Stephania cephalantha]|uniref:Uncharacterized protein n=1 Tax=Stephania cephalantha TaxID=152367 RepID=A0AAP0HZ16_9MAGN